MNTLSIQSMIPYKRRLKAYMVLKRMSGIRKLSVEDKELVDLIIAEQLEIIKEIALNNTNNIDDDTD